MLFSLQLYYHFTLEYWHKHNYASIVSKISILIILIINFHGIHTQILLFYLNSMITVLGGRNNMKKKSINCSPMRGTSM